MTPSQPPSATLQPAARRPIPLIGIVGGIGAGKSEVARILVRHGCIHSNSDAEARIALEQPAIRDTLAGWWGSEILDADGKVDRAAVARRIFAQPEERRRLEQLVHPLIHAARQRTVREAEASGAKAVIVDAPLLFEAGVDRECDAVIFVEAPESQRRARVAASRGWTDEDLTRREAAQLPLDDKRQRSSHVIANSGSFAELEAATVHVLDNILKDWRT